MIRWVYKSLLSGHLYLQVVAKLDDIEGVGTEPSLILRYGPLDDFIPLQAYQISAKVGGSLDPSKHVAPDKKKCFRYVTVALYIPCCV